MSDVRPFDPQRPLPPTTTVLEASAGTGKTHAIATLAVQLLGDGRTTIDRLLMVTFGRDASRELRARVRQRLLDELATAEPGPRRDHLAAASADFDRSVVMTIHEFCQAMYARLGVLALADPSGTVVPDLDPLVRDVAHDLYVQRYAFDDRPPPFPLADDQRDRNGAETLATQAVAHGLRTIVPEHPQGRVAERIDFARQVQAEAAARRRRAGVQTFDDQLQRLDDTLSDPQSGAESCRRLRAGFDAVLVDEFQDTDPLQWRILSQLFGQGVPLVLIGDPKQAIYTFRGADVRAYLRAADGADERYGLTVNYRSDGDLVEAVTTVFDGLRFADGIELPPIAAHRPGSALRRGDGVTEPLTLALLDQQQDSFRALDKVLADLVARTRVMLRDDRLVEHGTERSVHPGDIAVLVRTNWTARRVADALRAAGIPVALSGADSIYASPAAADWLVLLQALASGWRGDLRRALRTPFFAASLADLATADDDRLGEWTAIMRQWERILTRNGVAALFATIGAETDFIDRVLARPDGERTMTDFRHVAELLHEASPHDRPTAAWLADWLAQQLRRPAGESERTRRLETDSRAVEVKTVHRAKGLQFPIVLLPDLWRPTQGGDQGQALLLHDDDGRALVDLGGLDAPERRHRFRRAEQEEAEEQLRLLYVAFTRAQSCVVAWWARTRDTPYSALQRVLYRGRDQLPSTPAAGYPLDQPPGDSSPATLPWVRQARGVRAEDVVPHPVAPAPLPPVAPPALRARRFDRLIDADWRRTSYSGLTAGVHLEAPLLLDEPDQPEGTAQVGVDDTRSPLRDLPGGTQFGTLVHALFEHVDPSGGEQQLERRLRAAAAEWLPRFPLPGVDADALATALLPAFHTPLGPLADDRSIAAIPLADRLAELTFDLPMQPSRPLTLGDVADLVQRWLPATDPLAGYPALLRDPLLAPQRLSGFLTGSIDAVFRLGDPAQARHVVVDYKTNWLGTDELTLGDYSQAAMVRAMCASHYPLQALLYCVALHRFLAARLAGYDPDTHLGGVLYLFVRGMGGPHAGASTGVFAWHPPAGLVTALSAHMGGASHA